MESYLNPMVFIPVIVFAAGAIGYYFYHKIGEKYPKKKKLGTDDGKSEAKPEIVYQPIHAQVVDVTGLVPVWDYFELAGTVVGQILTNFKTLGVQQDLDDGKKGYQLRKTGAEFYEPFTYPLLGPDNPVDLNNDAEHWEYDLILSTLLKEEKNFMQKYGQVLWWAAVIGFIIFMMVSGK